MIDKHLTVNLGSRGTQPLFLTPPKWRATAASRARFCTPGTRLFRKFSPCKVRAHSFRRMDGAARPRRVEGTAFGPSPRAKQSKEISLPSIPNDGWGSAPARDGRTAPAKQRSREKSDRDGERARERAREREMEMEMEMEMERERDGETERAQAKRAQTKDAARNTTTHISLSLSFALF